MASKTQLIGDPPTVNFQIAVAVRKKIAQSIPQIATEKDVLKVHTGGLKTV